MPLPPPPLRPPTLDPEDDPRLDADSIVAVGAPGCSGRRPRSAQEQVDRARMRTVAVLVTGLAVGVLLSFAMTHLAGELRPLVDSADAFLVAPFVLGILMRSRRGAALAGLGCALLQFGAWEATSAVRGIPLGAPLTVWLALVGAIGGPLLGAAGQLVRRGPPALRGLGGAAAVAVLLAEGAWRDLHELHAHTIGWGSIALGIALGLALPHRLARVRWLTLTLPIALAGEIALSLVHR